MTQIEFVDMVHGELGDRGFSYTKCEIDMWIKLIGEVMNKALLSGKEVKLPMVGKFVFRDVSERSFIAPTTDDAVVVPEHKRIKFNCDKSLKCIKK